MAALFFAWICFLASVPTATSDQPLSNEVVFSEIYRSGEWGKSSKKGEWKENADGKGNSGSGSAYHYARPYAYFLQDFLADKKIKSVVDLGCGDWQFSKKINWRGIDYTGFDVVKKVVRKNNRKYGKSNIRFVQGDITQLDLPEADLLVCKDVLQHLPFEDIKRIIPQFSKFKYCLITNDVDLETLTCENRDLPRGHYRPIDLTQPPFQLKGTKVLTYKSYIEMKQVLLIENIK